MTSQISELVTDNGINTMSNNNKITPIKGITYDNSTLTKPFITYVSKIMCKLKLITEYRTRIFHDRMVLKTKDFIRSVMIYKKWKLIRPMYLQLHYYFYNFNIGCYDYKIDKFIKATINRAHILLDELQNIKIEYYQHFDKKQQRYLKLCEHTFDNYLLMQQQRSLFPANFLKNNTELPLDIVELIGTYI